MPTGYTSGIYNGKKVTFKQFALGCARAFGALIELRDSSADTPIPDEFKPSDHHSKELKVAEKTLKKANEYTDKEISVLARQDYEKELESWEESRRKGQELKERYEAMLKQVKAYEPPSPDHVGLKEFMAEQLQSSIKFDTSYHGERPKLKTPEEWRKATIKSATWSVNYHTEELAKEIERCQGRTKWVKQLKESLK